MSIRRPAILCLLALFACRRAPAGPDPNYEQASKLYQQLYASELDDAYGDPQMDRVVAFLKKVDSSSADADAARAMLGAIQNGREVLAKQRADREKMAAAAAASAATAVVNIDPSAVIAASAPVDAGPPQDPYGLGKQCEEQIARAFASRCSMQTIALRSTLEDGKQARLEALCAQRHAVDTVS